MDGLHPRRRSSTQGRPSSLSLQDEQAIPGLAVGQPARGPQYYAVQLAQQGLSLAPSTIYAACQDLDIRHTRTKPRHAWTNGFVERLQGTVLDEHWRIVFRRRYFTSRTQLEHSLQRFLTFYNDERPHFGYRTKGRTPSELFWGVSHLSKRRS